MFENTIKNITTGRQEMFDSALKMYKEMCPVVSKTNQAREAWMVMGNLQTMYREFDNNVCGLTLTALAENIERYKKFEQQCDEYNKVLGPYLNGDYDSRLEALMEGEVSIGAEVISVAGAAKRLKTVKENMANTKEWIEKTEQSLANKKYIMYQCHKQLKEIYDRFKADQAAQQKKEEKKPKRIMVMIGNSWPVSPREIQQAIDTLSAFIKVQGEGPIEKGLEGLKALKKGLEQDIMDHTKVVQDGLYFKLKTVE